MSEVDKDRLYGLLPSSTVDAMRRWGGPCGRCYGSSRSRPRRSKFRSTVSTRTGLSRPAKIGSCLTSPTSWVTARYTRRASQGTRARPEGGSATGSWSRAERWPTRSTTGGARVPSACWSRGPRRRGLAGRALEFYKLLAFTQALNHQRLERGRTVDVRRGGALGRLNGPFDELAHTVDARLIGSPRSRGRYNLPNVGLFVWRHRAYPVSEAPASPRKDAEGEHCFAFSVLGNDARLYCNPVPQSGPAEIAGETNLPVPILRQTLKEHLEELYGAGRSLYIQLEDSRKLILPEQIVVTDLGDWGRTPPQDKVAVDPELGRIAFNPSQAPSGVRVYYHYGFAANVGGGEYSRSVLWPAVRPLLGENDLKDSQELFSGLQDESELSRHLLERFGDETVTGLDEFAREAPPEELVEKVREELNGVVQSEALYGYAKELHETQDGLRDLQGSSLSVQAQKIQRLAGEDPQGWDLVRLNRMVVEYAYPNAINKSLAYYRVGEGEEHASIGAALERWRDETPRSAVIEIVDSGSYVEKLGISLEKDQILHIRAANRTRPVLRLLDPETGVAEALNVHGEDGSRFAVDGLMIAGHALRTGGEIAELTIRHSTLVPGRGLRPSGEPEQPTEPSLELVNAPYLRVSVEDSILGAIQVTRNDARSDPVRISLADSVLDATDSELEALGSPDAHNAHARVTLERSTVFGRLRAQALDLAENSIFEGLVKIDRHQKGCMRFCSLMGVPEARTPRRYNCQPDLAEQALREADRWLMLSEDERTAAVQRERERIRPRFSSTLYGTAAYCQLSEDCADEIVRGADDESELASSTTCLTLSARPICARGSTSTRWRAWKQQSSSRPRRTNMKGDFTRDTFDPTKHRLRVLQQQGRVELDSDFNEQVSILLHHLQGSIEDLIGPYGGPEHRCGFEVRPADEGNDFRLGEGVYYIDGMLCQNESEVLYTRQPDYEPGELENGTYLVYLEAWERHVTAIEDESIREVALGGADTSTRSEVVWQVKLLRFRRG